MIKKPALRSFLQPDAPDDNQNSQAGEDPFLAPSRLPIDKHHPSLHGVSIWAYLAIAVIVLCIITILLYAISSCFQTLIHDIRRRAQLAQDVKRRLYFDLEDQQDCDTSLSTAEEKQPYGVDDSFGANTPSTVVSPVTARLKSPARQSPIIRSPSSNNDWQRPTSTSTAFSTTKYGAYTLPNDSCSSIIEANLRAMREEIRETEKWNRYSRSSLCLDNLGIFKDKTNSRKIV